MGEVQGKEGKIAASLAKLIVPYRAEKTVERGVAVTREVLRATTELARERGATPILVVLQFGHEEQPEQMLRRRILDGAGITYVFVEVNSSWRLAWDRHPNARAARAIATAITSELRGRLAVVGTVDNVCGFNPILSLDVHRARTKFMTPILYGKYPLNAPIEVAKLGR